MRVNGKRLLIRADASAQIGTGHVLRCLALAQAWQDAGGEAVFAMAIESPGIEERLKSERMETVYLSAHPGSPEDTTQTAALARNLNASWIVVDGYVFDSDYQRAIRDARFRLLFIDDYGHCNHYSADVVLNQNIYADESFYTSIEPYTRLLLGSKFVLLRREFLKWRGWKREIVPVARKVLVTMGGADPDNATLTVIKALRKIEAMGLESRILIGALNPHRESLEREATGCNAQLMVAATDMPAMMAWADLAVMSAGTTCWEVAFMGLPGLTIVLAQNQNAIGEGLAIADIAVNAGWHNQLQVDSLASMLADLIRDYDARHRMSERGRSFVNGAGAQKAVDFLPSR